MPGKLAGWKREIRRINPEEDLFRCSDIFSFVKELGAEGLPLSVGKPGVPSYDVQLLRTSDRVGYTWLPITKRVAFDMYSLAVPGAGGAPASEKDQKVQLQKRTNKLMEVASHSNVRILSDLGTAAAGCSASELREVFDKALSETSKCDRYVACSEKEVSSILSVRISASSWGT